MNTADLPSVCAPETIVRDDIVSLCSVTRATSADRIAQVVVLAMLLAGPAFICLHSAFVSDADVWWHIRTGEWIAAHHGVPHAEPFSVLAGSPWLAYSWLFELIVYHLFHGFGLTGLVTYSVCMVLLITVGMYRMVTRFQSDFTIAAALTFVPMYAMGHMFTPRPWMFTILLFTLELDIIMQVRRTGRKVALLGLPLLFALWANTHIQFVDGLLVLGLVLAESILSRWWHEAERGAGPIWMALALVGSVAATLLNPYGWRVYAVAHDLATQSGALNKIMELQAIPFRSAPDFAVLVLALAATAALGWRRKLLSFEGALLAFAVVLSFRSQRDVWATAVVTSMILASSIHSGRTPTKSLSKSAYAVACVFAGCLVVIGSHVLHLTNKALQTQIDNTFPVQAVENARSLHLNGPIYSTFNWGGYLIWNLRLPVFMDGRQNVYGDQRMDRSVATWGGEQGWNTDPDLVSAAAVIAPMQSPLVQFLRKDQHFQDVYEDKVAAVFIPRR